MTIPWIMVSSLQLLVLFFAIVSTESINDEVRWPSDGNATVSLSVPKIDISLLSPNIDVISDSLVVRHINFDQSSILFRFKLIDSPEIDLEFIPCYQDTAGLNVSTSRWVLVNGTNEGVTYSSTEIMRLILGENYDELLRLFKRNLDSSNIAVETCADVAVTESYQISPREVAELITKETQLEQQAVQQQIEKVEKIQQVIEEEGAIILRTKREAEDEKQEEIRLLLMLLILWFLLCYCSGSTVPWCVDVDLTFGLSLALSEIVLLLGGDIEKNPGPLTGTWACTMMIGSSSIIVVCFLSRRRVGKSGLKMFV